MAAQKRSASGEPWGNKIKVEHPDEFSNAVKKKLQSSSRTGQACDRCKVRKIRCDGLAGGCSPCLQNNTECRTTDRITGRATSRGYVEGLEQQNRDMQQRIQELEHKLMQHGIDHRNPNGYQTAIHNHTYIPPPSTAAGWATTANKDAFTTSNDTEATPALRPGVTGDTFLGVASGNAKISAINGTALSILGMEIDIADFKLPDQDEPDTSIFNPRLYNKSYQAMIQSIFNVNERIEDLPLPPRQEGLTYAEWYFRTFHPYGPMLHKPTFMRMLIRMYDDPLFRPTTAETVMAHTVMAILLFQYAARNWEDKEQQSRLNDRSNLHYHYALSRFYGLTCSHTVQDVQALTLLCSHMRFFPKPGASWIMTETTLYLAIELGLHRSTTRLTGDAAPNPLEAHMRKRIFYALLALHISISGKLDRPMMLRLDDFDAEFPESLDDEALSEHGLDTTKAGKCYHEIGLQAYAIGLIYLDMYSTVYCVRRQPEAYVSNVNRLESKLRAWRESLPVEYASESDSEQTAQEKRICALYTRMFELEFRLMLRHPSISVTTNSAFNAESMRICVESARQMLAVVRQLQKYKSLDTTWYTSAIYVMAITTTLFSQWEKRGSTTVADLSALREEMDLWLDIMGDVGNIMGSGTRLREAVRVVTDGTLALLSRSIPGKHKGSVSQGQPSASLSHVPDRVGSVTNHGQSHGYDHQRSASIDQSHASSAFGTPDGQIHRQTPYPASTQHSSYPEADPSASNPTYKQEPRYPSYTMSADPVEAPLLAAFAAQASQLDPNAWQHQQAQNINTGSAAWQQWTSTISGNIEPLDSYSANVLMQLGGRDMAGGEQNHAGATMPNMNGGQVHYMGDQNNGTGQATGSTWPLNVFDIGSGVS